MLKKKYRLKKDSAFNATYKLNHSVCDRNIIVYLGKEKTDPSIPTKAGFVVSKKIHKRAVKRNRIKRLMREVYRLMLKNGEADFVQTKLSVIFIGRQDALKANLSEIRNSVTTLLKKLNK